MQQSKSVVQEVQIVAGTADDLASTIVLSNYQGLSGSYISENEYPQINTKLRSIKCIYQWGASNPAQPLDFGSASVRIELGIMVDGALTIVFDETLNNTYLNYGPPNGDSLSSEQAVFIDILNNYLFKNSTLYVKLTASASSPAGNRNVYCNSRLIIQQEKNIN